MPEAAGAGSEPGSGEGVSAHAARRGFGAAFVGFVFFSTSPALVAGASLGAIPVAFWRAWIAAALFTGLAAARRTLSRQTWIYTAAPGIAFGVATSFFFEAAQRTSVANATLISAMQPLPLVVAARYLFGERVGLPDLGWLALALSGTMFMILGADSSGSAALSGDIIAVGAMALSASYFVLGRRARHHLDALPFMAGTMLWAGLTLTPIMLVADQPVMPTGGSEWARLAAIALVPGIGHLMINYAHRSVALVVIGLLQLLMPIGATILALWFLDQSVTGYQFVGMAVVIVALAAHTSYRSRLAGLAA
jgi:drug/metabolite transporter (DMT)-like permease